MKRASNAWIFVSHSTRDLEKVRQVRNAIEAAGGEPILFFLKCLSDHNEVDELIKREIEARNFFLLCDSTNAKSSKWVQDEIAHVNSLQNKKIEVINLDSDWHSQISGIQAIVRHATVFLSYAYIDEATIAPIRAALIANDFSVWDPSHDLRVGDSFSKQISSAIEDTAKFGYFIHFLSRASLESNVHGVPRRERSGSCLHPASGWYTLCSKGFFLSGESVYRTARAPRFALKSICRGRRRGK